MRVRIEIVEGLEEPEVLIRTEKLSEEIRRLETILMGESINGYRDSEVFRIRTGDIVRIYGERQRVYAQTKDGVYLLHQRLYVLENQLDGRRFLRISNSEIVNCEMIARLDISVAGTIGVELEGGIQTFASRRYVKKLREYLGL